MAKLTSSRVLGMIKNTCDVQEWKTWNDPKGDKERTKINHLIALCCVKDCINTISVFEANYPDGVAVTIEKYKEKFELFRQRFIKEYPDDFIAYSLTLDLAPIGATKYNFKKDPALEVEKFAGKQQQEAEAEPESEQTESEYKSLSLRELRKLCRERDITVPSGAKEEDLIALLEEQDESVEQSSEDNEESEVEESDEEEETKPAPKKQPVKKVVKPEDEEEELEEPEKPTPKKSRKEVEEPDEDTEVEVEQPAQEQSVDEQEDEDVDEASAYDEMEIDELREECDRRGIEYQKGAKAHVLIELLTQDDKNSESDEEETQKEVDELDELLDENFVDEEIEAVAQEESNTKTAKAKKNKR